MGHSATSTSVREGRGFDLFVDYNDLVKNMGRGSVVVVGILERGVIGCLGVNTGEERGSSVMLPVA